MARPNLKFLWEAFLKLPDRKQEALDKFLYTYWKKWEECAMEMEAIKFGDMAMVCNVLAREFLADIHRVCSQSDDEEDTRPLQEYLLRQRGWMILFAMQKIGLGGLSCGRELGTLLVSLLPWCHKFKSVTGTESSATGQLDHTLSVDDCFACLSKCTPHHTVHVNRKRHLVASARTKGSHLYQRRAEYSVRKSFVKTSYEGAKYSSESAEETGMNTGKRKKSRKSKHRHSKHQSQSLSHYFSHQQLSPFDDGDDLDSVLTEVMTEKEEKSPLELCSLILDIICDLCLGDCQPMSPTKTISSTIMPQLLQSFLSSLDEISTSSSTCPQLPEENQVFFQIKLLHVILTASAMTVGLQNGINILVAHQIIPTLLAGAQTFSDLVMASKSRSDNTADILLCVQLVTHTVLGCLKLIEAIFQYLPFNLTFIKNSIRLMEEFRDNQGFEMLEWVILYQDAQCCAHHSTPGSKPSHEANCSSVVSIITDLISTLKITKVDYIHTMTCLKKKHRKCQFNQYLDHHHDILGPAAETASSPELCSVNADHLHSSYSPSMQRKTDPATHQNTTTCLVSMLAGFLLKLLPKLSSKQIQVQTLSSLYSAGICCCLSPDLLIQQVIDASGVMSSSVRSHLLEIMNRLLLEQLFAGNNVTHAQLEICQICSSDAHSAGRGEEIDQTSERLTRLVGDSGFSSNEALALTAFTKQDKASMTKWRALTKFKKLVFAEDTSMACLVARHLYVLAIKGNSAVKKQLFFNIIFVVFQLFKHRRSDSEESSGSELATGPDLSIGNLSYQVVHHCLAALPYLLQEYQILNAFLNKKGLQKLSNLLEESSLRQVVLKVLEALVIFDDRRMTKFTSSVRLDTSERSYSSSSSPKLTKDSQESIGRLVINTILDNLAAKSKLFRVPDAETLTDKQALIKDSSIDTDSYDSETNDSMFSNSELQKLEQLTVLTDLWNSCQFLCQKSKRFFHTFLDSSVAYLAFEKLREVVTALTIAHVPSEQSQLSYSDETLHVPDQTRAHHISTSIPLESSVIVFKHRLAVAEALLGVCFVTSASPATGVKQRQKLKQASQLVDVMKEALSQCKGLDSIRLKLLFDMLLTCSGILPKTSNRHRPRKFSDDDTADDLQTQLTTSSEEDSGTFHTEVGYESDSESSLSDDHRHDKLAGEHKPSQIQESERSNRESLTPVHHILTDLLVQFRETPTAHTLVPYVLQKLIQGIQANRWHAEAMCLEGCLEIILLGFRDTLISQRIEDKEEQGLLLELIKLLAQSGISSSELQLFLQLFTNTQPPLSPLLSCLMSIVEASTIGPLYSLMFPVHTLEVTPTEWRHKHSHGSSPRNVWDLCALHHSVRENLPWHTYQVTFTLAVWLSIGDEVTQTAGVRKAPTNGLYSLAMADAENTSPKRGKQDLLSNMNRECCHVVSLGTTEKLVEIWINLVNGSIILRLTSDMLDGEHILSECDWSGILVQNRWHHLVVKYSEKLDGSTLVGKATLVIDGCDVREFPLDHPALKVSAISPSLLIGHAVEDDQLESVKGKINLGNVMLFKGANLTCDICFHLFALGPNNTSISKCDCSNRKVNYGDHIGKKVVLHSAVSHDVLVGSKTISLTEAQESLLMSYAPRNPSLVCFYGQLKEFDLANMAGNLSGAVQAALSENRLLEQRPRNSNARVSAELQPRVKQRLEQTVQQSGGIGVFLFLVAKVFEDSPKHSGEATCPSIAGEKLQALVVRLLFAVLQHMPQLSVEFDQMCGYSMLAKVLTSSRCRVGYHTLKVLLDASTTESVLRYDRVSGQYVLRQKTESVVKNIKVIEELLLAWRIWEKADGAVTEMMFATLELLIREDHPHQEFNIKQFQSAGISDKMFLIYQERIQEGVSSLPVCVSQSVVSITRSLMGYPPDSHMIIAVCDFLLIMHPAMNTYIHNQKAGYYFNLWWNVPTVKESVPLKEVRANVKVSKTRQQTVAEESPSVEDVVSNKTLPGTAILRKSASFPTSPLHSLKAAGKEKNDDETSSSGSSLLEEETAVRRRSSSYPPITLTMTPMVAEVDKEQQRPIFSHELPLLSDESTTTQSSGNSLYDVHDKMLHDRKHPKEHVRARLESDELKGHHSDDTQSTQEVHRSGHHGCHEGTEEGVEVLSEGLLTLLCDIIANMPDSMVGETLTKIVRPEVLIVLAQNQSETIRTAVIKLFGVYLLRASIAQQKAFQKKEGFRLLCNQLHQYPASQELIELIGAMVFGESVSMSDSMDMSPMTAMSEVQKGGLNVLLALLDKTVTDMALCHNSLYSVSKIFESSPFAASDLLEYGLIETLCNLLAGVHANSSRSTDIVGVDENQLLVEDIHNLTIMVALREFSTSGIAHYQQFEDLMTLLWTLEDREKDVYGKDCKQTNNVKNLQLKIVKRVLDYVEVSTDGRDLSITQFHNTDTQQGFNSLKSLLMPSFFSSRAPKAEGGQTTPELPSSTPNATSIKTTVTTTSNQQLQITKAPKPPPHQKDLSIPPNALPSTLAAAEEGFSVRRKLSAVLDFIMEGSDSNFLGNFPGFDDGVTSSGMNDYSMFSGGAGTGGGFGGSARNTRVMSLDRKLVTKPSLLTGMEDPTPPPTSWSMTMFSPKKKLFVAVNQSELLERFKKLLSLSTDLVIYADHAEIKKSEKGKRVPLLFDSAKEVPADEFQKQLFSFLFRSLVVTLEKTFFGRKKNVIMWNAKDAIKLQFGRLLTFMLSPKVTFELRSYSLSYLAGDEHFREVLRLVLANHGAKIGIHLHDLLTNWRDRLNSAEVEEGCKLVTILRQSGFTVPSTDHTARPPSKEVLAAIEEEKETWHLEDDRAKVNWQKRRITAMNRIMTKHDSVSNRISANASDVTQLVTQLQNGERKKFFDHIKRSMMNRIQIKKSWQDLVQQLTHERAVWHCPESYPQSWQLDPTEGPCRVRRRHQRCHLGLEDRFLKPEFRHKLEHERVSPPLIYLFEDDHQTSDSAALIYRLYTNEKIQHTCKCTAVTPASESKGEILIGENCVYFVADEAMSDANYTQVLLGNKDQLSMTWPHVDIKEVHKMWYQLRDIALEIFLTNGKTCLLAFESTKVRDDLVQQLENVELPNRIQMENLTAIQQLWGEGRMTNFEYLTHLNKLSGRSFNDLMQYPVFPFILKDYVSKYLDLTNAGLFRDLSKPIAVQEKSREQKYSDNYNDDENAVMYRVTPYHYGSHYSNSGTVLQFLVRLPPFTKMFLSYQDNNFDIPDRTFHSMNTSWNLASYVSTTDVKELIPEFFFWPDFLQNKEGYDFGRRQGGEEVSDVALPPWCAQDARQFILIHRQALESSIVSQALHEWIDLVFGYKQQGEAAIRALNVFHPSTYFGVDVESIRDPVRRHALKTMIKTYGQTPKQLFFTPHPSKAVHVESAAGGLEKIAQLFSKPSSVPSHPVQPLTAVDTDETKSPLKQVLGLRWGVYVGSPDCAEPRPIWQTHYDEIVASLASLPTGEVFGIGANSCLLVMYSKERGVIAMNTTDVVWAAIVSWGYPDGVLRIQNKQDKPAVNFLFDEPSNEVCCCASLPDCRLLFTGGKTGVITVYNTSYNSAKESDILVFGHPKHLYGHSGAITSLQVCWPYSVLVSAGEDGSCIIWDLNRLTYVNSISGHSSPIKSVAVSDTLGDIATVSDEGMGSSLQLHSVNGELIRGEYCQQTINCLAYSSAPEGWSVNVIAGGLSSGVIRLWSSWDLTHVRDLEDHSLLAKPVISLTFTVDNQRLYMSTADGTVTVWESSSPTKGRRLPVIFQPFM